MSDFSMLEQAYGSAARAAASKEQYLQQKYPGVPRAEAEQREIDRSRPLTAGEIRIARSIYGNLIKYENTSIRNRKWKSFMPDGRPHAPDGHMYFDNDAGYKDDFSTGNMDERSTLIHELGHVWQHQRGEIVPVTVTLQWMPNSQSYNYTNVFQGNNRIGRLFDSIKYFLLPLEAQSEFLSDYYRIINGSSADSSMNKGYGRSEYERVMPPRLRGFAMGNGGGS